MSAIDTLLLHDLRSNNWPYIVIMPIFVFCHCGLIECLVCLCVLLFYSFFLCVCVGGGGSCVQFNFEEDLLYLILHPP